MSTPSASTPDEKPELRADGKPRTPKQAMHLRLARLMWHDVLDGYVKADLIRREIDRQLRLARATREDL